METKTNNPAPLLSVNIGGLFYLIAAISLLVGIFASVKTLTNLLLFKKYPTTGVLNMSFFGPPPYSQREEDCYYPQSYYTNDGKIRPATKEELENEKRTQQSCIQNVVVTREGTKNNDISVSIFFLFLGAGLIIVKKLAFK